ncbi:MAG TPA: threonyl-tRNA synthetase editing domain-containing protein [Sedimentisphaerales bacterium]|nr:threonyl-tRNA synthetase editing domain-containing protein [Sedimentisphaerales bacterium]
MILDCYQCSSCYFEDKEVSTRIDPATISPPQPRMEFNDVFVVFICVELYDDRRELDELVQEFANIADLLGKRPIVLCPNVHLSIDRAPEDQAVRLIAELEKMLLEKDYEVYRLSFGYHKKYGIQCNGNVGSTIGRRFYGSEERQFLRLLTRLGVCQPESLPRDMPDWAKPLTERRLKVLASRKEAYAVARQMLKDQLDATSHSEMWTCMLFEGERKPIDDYISTLYEIIEDYPDVRIHRAMNLSVPGFSNAARHLFRRYPDALESGRLCIYNSIVSDIEFLLTRSSVLLAFPHKPKKAGSHAGEISFGIYCKDADFARNMIHWYKTFLVDARFGWIRTEAELDATINELEEEKFQDKGQ